MPKSDNKHAINLYNSIKKHVNHAAAEDFIEKLHEAVNSFLSDARDECSEDCRDIGRATPSAAARWHSAIAGR